jgi:hypothetical protein
LIACPLQIGTPVGLAAGGAVLFENLRIMMFPDTDFHSAFTQPIAGEGTLYLSLDPGSVGASGCHLIATATTEETGTSDPYSLGRVIRLPRIDKFQLTDERDSGNFYLGSLTGEELQTIAKTGWNSRDGYPVQEFPTPVAGDPLKETLRIELPWPPPFPHAPVYVWLRGEAEGRVTQARY